MWVGVAGSTNGTAITGASFDVPYQNYGNGWYWVDIGQNSWLEVDAWDHDRTSVYTNGHASLHVWLIRQSSEMDRDPFKPRK
jgi:hypothetical protein